MNTFWWGIIIGGVVSLAASICANLLHNRIVEVLGSRKIASQAKRFDEAAHFHDLVGRLHTGKQNKYIYMMRLCVTIVGAFLAAMIAAMAGTLVWFISQTSYWEELISTPSGQMQMLLFFCSVLMTSLYVKATTYF